MMKNMLPVIMIVLIFLSGAGIFLYPSISNFIYERNSSELIESYTMAAEIDTEAKTAMLAEAAAYNDKLSGAELKDPFDFDNVQELMDDYENVLSVTESGMLGYVEIPRIDVRLPIYHGSSEDVLSRGVGHLAQSSFPIGREGDHAVLTGHSGLSTARLFTDLEQLEEGDLFFVTVLDDEFAYRVDQILVVEPDDTSSLYTVEGYDYITLITCTPYSINSHRLLVRGVRTDDRLAQQEKEQYENRGINWRRTITIGFILLAIVVLVFLHIRKKVARRRQLSGRQS